LIELNHN